MITTLSPKHHSLHFLTEFLAREPSFDFYFTHENTRYFITDQKSLKQLLKQSSQIFVFEDERREFKGIIMLWKSVGGGLTRYYLKLNAADIDSAEKLLTVLLWNFDAADIYAKFRKDNKFLPILKNKGFRFKSSRGIQILLHRKAIKINKPQIYEEEEI